MSRTTRTLVRPDRRDSAQFHLEYLHFHCVVIDGVFDATTAGGVVFHAAAGLDAPAVAAVQACVRRRLLRVFVRRGLLPGDDAQAMAQWAHDGGSSVNASVRIEVADRAGRERLLRYCIRPAFALDRLREPDPEHPLYKRTKPGPGGTGPLLLTRIYEVLPLLCPLCGAEMHIVAFITDGSSVRDILARLGEPTAPPRIAPAGGPPLWDLPDAGAGDFDPHAQPAPEYRFDQRLTS